MKRWQKIVIAIHLIGLLLCATLLLALPERDHLRWDIGYAIVWITTLGAFAFVFVRAKKKWLDFGFKFYGTIWVAVILLPILVVQGFWLMVLGEIYIPHRKYYETDGYVMRSGYSGLIDYPRVALWKKEGVMEKYIRDYPSFETAEMFEIRDDIGAVVIHGASFKLDDGENSEKYVDVCPLNDSVFYANRHSVEELKRELQKGGKK